MIALLLAGGISMVFTLVATPLFVRLFRRLRWGQFVRVDTAVDHKTKRGTPTMGGIVFITGALLGYFLGKIPTLDEFGYSASALLVIMLMVGLGLVGFLDDFIKISRQRSLGLTPWAKIAGQVLIASVFAVLALNFPDRYGQTPASSAISFIRDIPQLDFRVLGLVVGGILFAIWVLLIVVSTSNGVNIADGLDGLATGASIFSIGSFIFIGFWQFNQSCVNLPGDDPLLYKCYEARDPMDLAILATAITGGLIGFLWWNTSPAQIFMGDTGSLALGGALAGLAILSRTELLLVLIGGLFVISAGSVVLQRASMKIRKKRIFRMSPIHHHFELKGWAEVTVVVRFWIIAALCVAGGVGLFYLEWVSR